MVYFNFEKFKNKTIFFKTLFENVYYLTFTNLFDELCNPIDFFLSLRLEDFLNNLVVIHTNVCN